MYSAHICSDLIMLRPATSHTLHRPDSPGPAASAASPESDLDGHQTVRLAPPASCRLEPLQCYLCLETRRMIPALTLHLLLLPLIQLSSQKTLKTSSPLSGYQGPPLINLSCCSFRYRIYADNSAAGRAAWCEPHHRQTLNDRAAHCCRSGPAPVAA